MNKEYLVYRFSQDFKLVPDAIVITKRYAFMSIFKPATSHRTTFLTLSIWMPANLTGNANPTLLFILIRHYQSSKKERKKQKGNKTAKKIPVCPSGGGTPPVLGEFRS
jgi:hypothetical protein